MNQRSQQQTEKGKTDRLPEETFFFMNIREIRASNCSRSNQSVYQGFARSSILAGNSASMPLARCFVGCLVKSPELGGWSVAL